MGSDTANLSTTATADGDGYLVSGAKQWITNGGFAELFVLFARTGGPGAKGVSAFLAEPGEGFTVGREIPKLGLHTSSTVELAFDGHRVRGEPACSATEGKGLKIALSTLDCGPHHHRRPGAAASPAPRSSWPCPTPASAPPSGARSRASRASSSRSPRSPRELDAARLLMLHAARLRDAGQPHTAAGAKAKLVASAVAVDAADTCVQTLGGYGYSAEFPAERLYRDAKITQIYEGTSEIQRMVIARDLWGDAARG